MLQILMQDGHAPDKEAKNKVAIKSENILLFISEVFRSALRHLSL